MLYERAARKTFAFIGISLALSLALVTLFFGDNTAPTGFVVAQGDPGADISWPVVIVLIAAGALMAVGYFYVRRVERKPDEI